jgi:lysine biosynthesis protein LysW
MMAKKMTAHCPECDAEIDLSGVVLNEIVVCSDCGVDLEVIDLPPHPRAGADGSRGLGRVVSSNDCHCEPPAPGFGGASAKQSQRQIGRLLRRKASSQ